MSFTKRRVRWRFGFPNLEALEAGKTGPDCRGSEHELSFVWSITSGKKSIVFDNEEVHCSDSRQSLFEFSWSRDNKHVFKIIANAVGGGDRQYDFHVDGQSYFDMPKMYEVSWDLYLLLCQLQKLCSLCYRQTLTPVPQLGLPNAGFLRSDARAAQPLASPPHLYPLQNSSYFAASPSSPPRKTLAIGAPRSQEEEEADLQRAIRMSLAESAAHLTSQPRSNLEIEAEPPQRDLLSDDFGMLTLMAPGTAPAPAPPALFQQQQIQQQQIPQTPLLASEEWTAFMGGEVLDARGAQLSKQPPLSSQPPLSMTSRPPPQQPLQIDTHELEGGWYQSRPAADGAATQGSTQGSTQQPLGSLVNLGNLNAPPLGVHNPFDAVQRQPTLAEQRQKQQQQRPGAGAGAGAGGGRGGNDGFRGSAF
jgi:hypothetical protein